MDVRFLMNRSFRIILAFAFLSILFVYIGFCAGSSLTSDFLPKDPLSTADSFASCIRVISFSLAPRLAVFAGIFFFSFTPYCTVISLVCASCFSFFAGAVLSAGKMGAIAVTASYLLSDALVSVFCTVSVIRLRGFFSAECEEGNDRKALVFSQWKSFLCFSGMASFFHTLLTVLNHVLQG